MKIISNIDAFPGEFPTEIMALILARLPVESILRCKSVSKSWCSLISSTYFINLQVNHNQSLGHDHYNSHYFLITEHRYNYPHPYLERRALNSNLIPSKTIFIPPQTDSPEIERVTLVRGSCNGLVALLYSEHLYNFETDVSQPKYEIVLWNPSTNNYVVLPFIECPPELRCLGCTDIGLGYDRLNDDYKVVRVYFTPPQGQFYVVYSLKHNCWGQHSFDYDGAFMTYEGGVLIQNHILHWRCYDRIRGFDVCSEEWFDLSLPVVDEHHCKPNDLRALRDSLCLVTNSEHSGSPEADVWVMKEYGVEESWYRLCRIREVFFVRSPIVYSRGGDEILLKVVAKSSGLLWYNLNDKTFKVGGTYHPEEYHTLCVASLVPLNGHNRVIKRSEIKGD